MAEIRFNSYMGLPALSNFAACPVQLDGVIYPSVEAAYQAAKTVVKAERTRFKRADAKQAKRLGRSVTLRYDWETVKFEVMEALLEQKFNQSPFKELLTGTGDVPLVHYCPWGDTTWGVDKSLRGQNILGRMLEELRCKLI